MVTPVEPPSFGGYLRHLRERKGLGRTDLAAGSKISFGYVTKLEQGVLDQPSPPVVEQLATTVAANSQERQHLHDLVAYHRNTDCTADDDPASREVTADMRQYVDRLAPNLAGYVDAAWNVLYANGEYARIFRHIAHPDVGNVLTWFFMVRESKAVMVEWEVEARLTVAWLRALMAQHPGSRLFKRLLDDLSQSGDFVRMWSKQEIFMARHTPYMLVRDLDHGQELRLIAQVHTWPDPAKALQLYLGVRDSGED